MLFSKPKGTQDFYGQKIQALKLVEAVFTKICKAYNFEQILTPTFEHQEVFIRSVGENSDIISKEVYAFKDRMQRDLVLKPEGTAAVVRSFIENRLFHKHKFYPHKFYYFDKMFRYEQPQSGRYREFFQAGVELFSQKQHVLQDLEIIEMAYEFLKALGLKNFELKLNFLGINNELKNFSKALGEFFSRYSSQLNTSSLERLKANNPLRILDDKEMRLKPFFEEAPKIIDFLEETSLDYFQSLQEKLSLKNIPFTVDYSLVRGLDYYTGVVFEFIDKSVNSNADTILGGGRYNQLVSLLGGPEFLGIGFAAGVERLIRLLNLEELIPKDSQKIYVAFLKRLTPEQENDLLFLINELRKHFVVEYNYIPFEVNDAFEAFFKLEFDFLVLPQKEEEVFELINNRKEKQILSKEEMFQFLEKQQRQLGCEKDK